MAREHVQKGRRQVRQHAGPEASSGERGNLVVDKNLREQTMMLQPKFGFRTKTGRRYERGGQDGRIYVRHPIVPITSATDPDTLSGAVCTVRKTTSKAG